MTAISDPIAIVGMAVEAPGRIDSLPQFWTALAEARELIGPFPRDRGWSLERLDTAAGGTASIPDAGGFLYGATEFDPEFFGIALSEARVAMDPQQWVALRVAWRALENTGVNPSDLKGDELGCYMGVSFNEHPGRAGKTLGGISGRISHCLGVTGPSFSVDTACSSALTALHLAAAAIRQGDCEWALAGSVCVMGTPSAFFESTKVRALSDDGHCRSFADGTTGTVWAEGAGAVVLERESRARTLGHRVYGKILGSHVNHNGGGQRPLLPSAAAQERIIRRVLTNADLTTDMIGMIEGHGAAIRAGDTIEVTALQKVFDPANTVGDGPLLGSVKSNLGHAQAAAGILGLIKVLLCGVNGQIAPTLFADNPTSTVDWEQGRVRLASKLQPWEPHEGFRYGAVSAFGLSGTNGHVIMAMPDRSESD